MKKQILALIACLMLVMSTTAQAVTLRVPVASPSLSFSGTTARGSAICQADGNNDRINAKLIFYICACYCCKYVVKCVNLRRI